MDSYTMYETVGYGYPMAQRLKEMGMCEILVKIQNKIIHCMKTGNSFERDILKTVVGEIQTIKSRTGEMTNDGAIKIIKKFKQGVEETIELNNKMDFNPILLHDEIKIYDQYIPATMGIEGIIKFIDGKEPIISAKSDGQATGIAMGILKKANIPVEGKDVAEAVKQIRS